MNIVKGGMGVMKNGGFIGNDRRQQKETARHLREKRLNAKGNKCIRASPEATLND
jgi:hypothetical protein